MIHDYLSYLGRLFGLAIINTSCYNISTSRQMFDFIFLLKINYKN